MDFETRCVREQGVKSKLRDFGFGKGGMTLLVTTLSKRVGQVWHSCVKMGSLVLFMLEKLLRHPK